MSIFEQAFHKLTAFTSSEDTCYQVQQIPFGLKNAPGSLLRRISFGMTRSARFILEPTMDNIAHHRQPWLSIAPHTATYQSCQYTVRCEVPFFWTTIMCGKPPSGEEESKRVPPRRLGVEIWLLGGLSFPQSSHLPTVHNVRLC